jgi:hypothetical protein
LNPAITVMDELILFAYVTIVERLFKRIQCNVCS